MEFHSLLKELGPGEDARVRDYRAIGTGDELKAWMAAIPEGAPIAIAIAESAELRRQPLVAGLLDAPIAIAIAKSAEGEGAAAEGEFAFAQGEVGTDTIGLYDPATSSFYLRYNNTTGFANAALAYGPAGAGWRPIAGDWDGDGTTTIGLFSPASSEFFLRNTNTTGYADLTFTFGSGYISQTSSISNGNTSAAAAPATLDTSGLSSSTADMPPPATAAAGPRLPALAPRAVDRIDLSAAVERGAGSAAGLNDFDFSANDLTSGLPGASARRNASQTDAILMPS